MGLKQAERDEQNQEMGQRNRAINIPIGMIINEAFDTDMPVSHNPHPVLLDWRERQVSKGGSSRKQLTYGRKSQGRSSEGRNGAVSCIAGDFAFPLLGELASGCSAEGLRDA